MADNNSDGSREQNGPNQGEASSAASVGAPWWADFYPQTTPVPKGHFLCLQKHNLANFGDFPRLAGVVTRTHPTWPLNKLLTHCLSPSSSGLI
jgi:hypothetical protein